MVLSGVFGGLAGYGWHKLVGCKSGGCPITANPYFSTLWGAAIAVILAAGR
jgi:hypothetical protein